eukprot:NODE_543_length_6231_cov_0.300718.p3 type:complete len:241 gc:universal NODE_543_length_6231_cov_0.300718:2573-1851(-)
MFFALLCVFGIWESLSGLIRQPTTVDDPNDPNDSLSQRLLLDDRSENIYENRAHLDLRVQIKELHHRQFRKSHKACHYDTTLNDNDKDKAWIINKLYYFWEFYRKTPYDPWIPSIEQNDVWFCMRMALFKKIGDKIFVNLIENVIHHYKDKIDLKPLIGDLVVYFVMNRPKSKEEATSFLNDIGQRNTLNRFDEIYARYLPDVPEYYSGNSIYSPEKEDVLPYLPREWVSKFDSLKFTNN